MRLVKFSIGSSKDSPTHRFKNLKDVNIDFDQNHWITVIIGWNGAGKSNVMEALAIIFRDLIQKRSTPSFAYKLEYYTGNAENMKIVKINADPDEEKDKYQIKILARNTDPKHGVSVSKHKFSNGAEDYFEENIKFSDFVHEKNSYLPRYVFSYYSGESNRMSEVFRSYTEKYDKKLRNGENPGLKRLFYALPVHSQFVLLAFLTHNNDTVRDFLECHLGLDTAEGIESVLFVMRQPPWNSPEGDPRFWNARGIVKNFLDRLYSISLAPIRIKRRVPVSLWNNKVLEFLYLYVKDLDSLRTLVGNQSSTEFFRDLESTYVSELIEEVRIRVRLKKNDGSVTFRELSEGEQQLLTVLGLLCFTAGEESLFLLDEPDTHLNPRWCVDYLSYLSKIMGNDDSRATSNILFTTHNPLTIAELEKEQVQILQMKEDEDGRKIIVCNPDLDPRGQGYASIITSEMFGIASSIDESTQMLLEQQRLYAFKDKLSDEEQLDLDEINEKLDRFGFRFSHPDDEYSRYLRLRYKTLSNYYNSENPKEIASKVIQMSREEREALAEKLLKDLFVTQ